MAKLIKRGELWLVNLEPSFGREIHKKRPGLVISVDKINYLTPHVIIIPTTSLVPKILSEEMVLAENIKGLDKKSLFLPIFIRSIDQDRLMRKIGKIPNDKLNEVEEAMKLVLGLTEID